MPVVVMAAVLTTSCNEEYTTYTGPEYVMFADSISTNMVLADGEAFAVTVASTVKCDYDRTFGVEVVDKGSNAIEGVHYTLESNSVTIPAGEMAANKTDGGVEDVPPVLRALEEELRISLQAFIPLPVPCSPLP